MEVKPGYKLTEAGVIPNDWHAARLGDALTLERGFDLPARLRREGTIPVVSSSGATSTHSEHAATSPGIVTGRYGTIGKVFFIEEDYWPLNTTLFSRSFHGNDPKFLTYLLRTVDFQTHSGKSGVPGVNRNDIHELIAAIPPVEQQRAIAKALSDVDALLAALDRLIAKKRDLKQAAMQQLLTGKTRLPGFDGEWTTTVVGELLRICHGRNQVAVQTEGGQYPILASGGEIGRAREFLMEAPSVLIGRKGTIDRPQYIEEPFWTVDTLFYSELIGRNVAKFFYYKFCMIDWRLYNEGSGVPSLNARTIEAIPIAVPRPEEQAAISESLSVIDYEITTLMSRRRKIELLKQGMMQELLTGKTRLVKPETHDA